MPVGSSSAFSGVRKWGKGIDRHYCHQCGQGVVKGDQFCGACGTKLKPDADSVCLVCGKPAKTDDRFCVHCGAPLHPPAVPTSPIKPASPAPRPLPPVSKSGGSALAPRSGPGIPHATEKPSRLWPRTVGGKVALVGLLVITALGGLAAGEGDPFAAAFALITVSALYLIWRNMLISFGVIRPRPRPSARGTSATPARTLTPDATSPPTDGGEGSRQGGVIAGIATLVVTLIAIALARGCGKAIGTWIGEQF